MDRITMSYEKGGNNEGWTALDLKAPDAKRENGEVDNCVVEG